MTLSELNLQLKQSDTLMQHPSAAALIDIATGETNVSTAGFPYLTDKSFRTFTQQVPHLFLDGQSILNWLGVLSQELSAVHSKLPEDVDASLQRAMKVLRSVVFTAAITAPSDLWILRQVLSVHKKLGILDWLVEGHTIIPEDYAQQHGLDVHQLASDLHFLHVRGFLEKGDGDFWGPNQPTVLAQLESVTVLEDAFHVNMVPLLVDWLAQTNTTSEHEQFLNQWLILSAHHQSMGNWMASLYQVELGYRLLPLVLALRVLNLTASLKQGERIDSLIPRLLPAMQHVLVEAGLVQNSVVTQLGARVFERGPGPFGIIGAYHAYLTHLEALLKGNADVGAWVHRGENVSASQDANRKTFQAANANLNRFCEAYGFKYEVFIEHAVGQGEAIRQRFEQDGEDPLKYFGADLEPKAIEAAIQQQKQGVLPKNLEFICPADIGEPKKVIEYLQEKDLDNKPTVLMVGNGFHEIRQQTNEKMIEVFRQYQEAGYVLIFTEESALNDEALVHTAWNTYHAGFRYVHELSGQGLRPARGTGQRSERWSWRRCASLGGYLVLDEYSHRTRTIYPYPRPQNKNPSISETLFCIPLQLALELGIEIEE